jgi:hypothetical protein
MGRGITRSEATAISSLALLDPLLKKCRWNPPLKWRLIKPQMEGPVDKWLRRNSMPTKQQREQDRDLEQHKTEALRSLVEEQAIHRLGKPVGLRNMQVRRLWENRYRVNVIVGENAVSAKIAKSYFVKSDSDGNIVDSNPAMTKLCSLRW